jgi:hypothetical protein
MRVIKLSPDDEEMTSRSAVLHYFSETLWTKSRFGRFGLTPGKSKMQGIQEGTLLLFTYEKECMFLGCAAGPITHTTNPDFPAFMPISMGSLVPVSGSLEDFEGTLRKHGLLEKNLVHAQAWPILEDSASRFAEKYFHYSAARRFVFVRVGWMQHYRGVTPGDERPIGGGGYNRGEVGHEICNFLPLRGKLYGYYQPQMRADQTDLARIDSSASAAAELENATVIWVARHPSGGQQIIGWYREATVYRTLGPEVAGRPDGFEDYRCTTDKEQGTLIPVSAREFQIPHGKGGFGQANICYPLSSDGTRKEAQWIFRALCYVKGYAGGNVVENPTDEALKTVVQELEAAQEGRGGQGFGGTAKDRAAIEALGMEAATDFFEKKDYQVENVSKKQPYDLHCTLGSKELRVEVKATTNTAEKVFITQREALHAMKPEFQRALFILHSIQLEGGEASGGIPVVIEPWTLNLKDATPVVYSYRPPKSK